MPEIQYSVIGQGSHHEVYMLHGVKGGVIAIVDKDLGIVCHLLLAIRNMENNKHILLPEFVDPSINVGGRILDSDWGWTGYYNEEYPEIHKYKARYVNQFLGHPDQEYRCIEYIKTMFKTLKEVYDRNTIR